MGCDFIYYKDGQKVESFQYPRHIRDIHSTCISWKCTKISEFIFGLKTDIGDIEQMIRDTENDYGIYSQEFHRLEFPDRSRYLNRAKELIDNMISKQNTIEEYEKALKYYKEQLDFINEYKIDSVSISF